MSLAHALDLASRGMLVALWVSAPALVATFFAAIAFGLVATPAQVTDPAASHLPRLVAGSLALVFAGGWMLRTLVYFAAGTWGSIATLAG